jgi:hypothetical protein
VVASFDSQIEIADSLDEVLELLFGPPGTGGDGGDGDGDGVGDVTPPEGTIQEQVAELLARAQLAFDAADRALVAGDLAEYQKRVDEAAAYIAQANRIIAEAAVAAAEGSDTSA